MKKTLLLFVAMFAISFSSFAQESLDELKAMKADKQAMKKTVDQDIADLDKKIKEFPGWTKGLGGTLGLNFGGATDWYGQDVENLSSRGLGLAVNAFANKNGEDNKYFWHNNMNISYNSSNQTNEDLNDDGTLQPEQEITNTASYFGLSSLGGYAIFNNVFASAEGRYETTFNDFNDPGKLTFSAGATWKPMNNLTIVVHPIGYQINFPSSVLAAATGAKIGATYNGDIYPGVKWTSELNAFLAYGGDDTKFRPDGVTALSGGDLSNWTWFNTFAVADVFKGIGVGLSVGLRNDKQLGFAKNITDPGMQVLYNLGLSYAFAR